MNKFEQKLKYISGKFVEANSEYEQNFMDEEWVILRRKIQGVEFTIQFLATDPDDGVDESLDVNVYVTAYEFNVNHYICECYINSNKEDDIEKVVRYVEEDIEQFMSPAVTRERLFPEYVINALRTKFEPRKVLLG